MLKIICRKTNDIKISELCIQIAQVQTFSAAYAAGKGRSPPCIPPYILGSVGGFAPDTPGSASCSLCSLYTGLSYLNDIGRKTAFLAGGPQGVEYPGGAGVFNGIY